jgi:37-kD nucleoid-associated bacterial protein
MLDFSTTRLHMLILHKVGNKAKGEENFISKAEYEPDEEQSQELLEYFLLPFKSVSELYKFTHATDIEYNEVNGYSSKIFRRKDTFINRSADILRHLYEQSEHPNIKTGEVCIAYFTDLIYENQQIDAIGIFKSERKDSFFQFKKQGDKLTVDTHKGVLVKKLDKGCLILNVEENDGYRVLTVDNNNYDAEYWRDGFLSIEDAKDFNYQTRNYVALCKEFTTEILQPRVGAKEGISFLNQSIKYLTDNDTLELDDFAESVLNDSNLRKEFKKYRKQFENEHDVQIEEEFEISKSTLRKQKRKLKSQINLDTQVQINLGNVDVESGAEIIERGFDQRKGMFYYKIYFNKEN